ncbi:hypothetical protein ISF_05395 [Cordyceps fumosorosea ARSEF 2679]|uniref:ATP synthase F0 n=1 Tax=Cordyceps fumosorosea (strain ARSEF 2679) TaxID=1081104 RepID=A0A167U7M7_CORFA|nr:hypothetical protein ISF_05395 [Cordyceps fumosorosea ARSEF 2679]OAA61316.1 hypothetical protein ISF_05395 [Cordyceps fumosorosea ARSEF 2679]
MANLNRFNPFSRRESHSVGAITTYKILTLLTWLLSVVVSVWYTVRGHIWAINYHHRSAFTMNSIIASIFWIVLFALQLGYVAHLFSANADLVNAASSVGSHFIVNNVLHALFVWLFAGRHFHWAEVVLVANLVNLVSLYFRHNKHPRFIHAPVVSGPLAWTFVAIYWNGAIMVPHQDSLVARVFANVFIWSLLAFGLFFLGDYTMSFSLSVLAAAIGVAQFTHHIVALQWIFAFTIMAILFLATLGVAVPVWTGRDIRWRKRTEITDAERAPLLNE